MAKFHLGALLVFAAASAQAQPHMPAPPINPSVESAQQRQALHDFSFCLAQRRPVWARRTLAEPYLSDAQARIASYALSGRDGCIQGDGVEVVFRTSSLVSSLAEYFLRAEMERVDLARLSTTLSATEPLNVSEDFALCVAARNPAAARDLALSALGSNAEIAAADALADAVLTCRMDGEDPTVDLQSLRALTATALYRGVTAALGTRN